MKFLVFSLLPLVLIGGCASSKLGSDANAKSVEAGATSQAIVRQEVTPLASPIIHETVAAQSTALARLEATVTALTPRVAGLPQSTATIIPLPPQRSASAAANTLVTAETPPATDLARYVHPSGLWSIQYPFHLLQREGLTDNVILFISDDRATFAAVDTYLPMGDEYGQAGEGLRARAQETLNRIYGKQVTLSGTLPNPQDPWEAGVIFTTELGSTGQAVYTQPGRAQGDLRVFGFLYGYKQSLEPMMRPMIEAVKATLVFSG